MAMSCTRCFNYAQTLLELRYANDKLEAQIIQLLNENHKIKQSILDQAEFNLDAKEQQVLKDYCTVKEGCF